MKIAQDNIEGFDGNVKLIQWPAASDPRGQLVEYDHALLPFMPQRTFIVGDVPVGTVRGVHAHKACQQVLICLKGRTTVELACKACRTELVLTEPTRALYINAGIWARQRYDAEGTWLLVFASQPFDPDSYLPEPSR